MTWRQFYGDEFEFLFWSLVREYAAAYQQRPECSSAVRRKTLSHLHVLTCLVAAARRACLGVGS